MKRLACTLFSSWYTMSNLFRYRNVSLITDPRCVIMVVMFAAFEPHGGLSELHESTNAFLYLLQCMLLMRGEYRDVQIFIVVRM